MNYLPCENCGNQTMKTSRRGYCIGQKLLCETCRKVRRAETKKLYMKQWKPANRQHIRDLNNTYLKKRRKTDIVFKLRERIRNEIYSALSGGKAGKSHLKYVDWTHAELKVHLESLWEPWMNWDNWGIYNPATFDSNPTWQIDHIIPRCQLPYISMEDNNFKKCWALNNLRPISSKQNIMNSINQKAA
jgi:hypothetical protein